MRLDLSSIIFIILWFIFVSELIQILQTNTQPDDRHDQTDVVSFGQKQDRIEKNKAKTEDCDNQRTLHGIRLSNLLYQPG